MRYHERTDGPGQIFHISARVNWRTWHLRDDHTKLSLCELLGQSAEAFGVQIYGAVLMDNHLHAVLQSPPDELYRQLTGRRTPGRHFRAWPPTHQNASVIAQYMRRVRRTMTVRKHKQLELSGRFWEGPYDARPVSSSISLATRIAYDHFNPVKEGMVTHAEEYTWSTAAEWLRGTPGVLPLRLPVDPPFEMTWDELRTIIRDLQRSERMDGVRDRLGTLLRGREDLDPLELGALLA